MKDTFKKIMSVTMLLSFALTTPISSSLALASGGDMLAYSMDYMPDIRGSQPAIVSLGSTEGITNKELPISLSLRDSDVRQVLRMFADKAGKNIIFKGDINKKVTMDLVNIPLNSAFNMVMTATDLTYAIQDNTLLISPAGTDSTVSMQEMSVIPVKYVNAGAISDFLNKNIYTIKKPGMAGLEVASVNPATNELIILGSDNDATVARKVVAQFDKKPVVTSFKVNHSTPKQMAEMICNMLLPGAGVSQDKDKVSLEGVITGAASESGSEGDTGTISLGEGAIACSSAAQKDASMNEEKKSLTPLGLGGITVAYYTQAGTVNLIGGSAQQIEMVKEFISSNDKRQPQAYLEFSIIELNETGSREFSNEWSFVSQHFKMNFNGNDGVQVSPFRVLGHGDRPTYTIASNSHPTLLYSLNLLLKSGKGRTISNPRIIVTNGQESVIDMTEDYVKTVTSQIVQGSYSNVPTVERTYEIGDDMGLKISVTPFISPDGYLYLNMKPDLAAEKEKVYYTNSETNTRDLAATLLRKNNLDLKNIRIKDGDTLILAGMMKETETKNVSKIPFLGDIPGLGMLFRSSSLDKEKSELVILVTPKIITDSDVPSDRVENSL